MINRDNYVYISSMDTELYNLEDEWVLIDKTQEKVAIMNETAFVLWECIRSVSKIKIKELYNIIKAKYKDVDRTQLEQDVNDTIDLLLKENFIYEI